MKNNDNKILIKLNNNNYSIAPTIVLYYENVEKLFQTIYYPTSTRYRHLWFV